MAILRGRVVDAQQIAQKEVAVCAPAVSQCIVTDDAGAFTLMLRPGTYTLALAAPGRLIVISSDIQVGAGLDTVELRLPQGQDFDQGDISGVAGPIHRSIRPCRQHSVVLCTICRASTLSGRPIIFVWTCALTGRFASANASRRSSRGRT